MTAKVFMSQALEANKRINRKQLRLEEYKAQAESTATALNGLPRKASPNLQRMESVAVMIVDLSKEIDADIDELDSIKQRISDVILMVEDPSQSVLLELRYIWFLPWNRVAARMELSESRAMKIHRKALESISGMLQCGTF